MAKYINSFIVAVPKKSLKTYCQIAKKTAKIWLKHGALEYTECSGDDIPKGQITSFPRSVKMKPSETMTLTFVTFRSRNQRDLVMDRVMSDPEMQKLWEAMPVDGMRMVFGGFNAFVSLKKK